VVIYDVKKNVKSRAVRYKKENWDYFKFPHKEIFVWHFGYLQYIKPGEFNNNIGFSSKGLPGIVHCYVQGKNAMSCGWSEFPGEWAYIQPQRSDFKTKLYGKTVGAVEWFKTAEEGLKLLEDYTNESFVQGWIETEPEKNRILKEIGELKKIVISKQTLEIKKQIIENFMKDIQKSFDDKKILSESFALLYYNARALIKILN